MNERIREPYYSLMYKASEGWNDHLFQVPPELLEKFAELIVKECLRQVEEQYKPVLEDETMMKDTHWDGYVQCGVDSYVAIREHFYGEEELK